MVQRQIQTESQICPECGMRLSPERDLLFCREHGAFFTYGPQLLVRAARPATKPGEATLPWESPRTRLG
jgi:hypothetical protein